MERANIDWEQKRLVNELTQGKELATQLKYHLTPTSSSIETHQFLVEKILFSYEKALSMLNWDFNPKNNSSIGAFQSVLPRSNNSFADWSPKSDHVTDIDSKDQRNNNNVLYKKRKTQPRWTEQVKVCSESNGLEGPLNDGYNWRKYGQKEIIGASFPRGYYRCTHRYSQGCLATKLVQKSDMDPTIFEVTYKGRHTCINRKPSPSNAKQTKELESTKMPLNCDPSFKIEIEDSIDTKEDIFPSFSFSYTINGDESEGSYIFGDSIIETDLLGLVNNIDIGHTVQITQSGDISSAPTSITNSPVGRFDVAIDNFDFNPDFSFDSLEFSN